LKPHQEVLAITFTNKAAREIDERLKKRVKTGDKLFSVGTFHSFALRQLLNYQPLTDLQEDFQIIDEMAFEEISKTLWPNFTKKQRKDILNKISRHKSINFDQEAFAEFKRYEAHLRDLNYIDYDDVLLKIVKLLENEKIRHEIQDRFPY